MTDSEIKNAPESKRPFRNSTEWLSFGIASLIVGTVAGLVIYSWAMGRNSPPSLTIYRTEPVREADGQFYVPFEIVNTGGETAESVQVIAELKVNAAIQESGDLQIDFLSRGETEKAAFVFKTDPRQGDLVVRVASYKTP
ncbi:TIGR02588 family protein [Phormidium sp. CLA17]|uniref:TIGR02588 family protein n=1 Tax=Leptolyngbya sp. Cla-17 TaxID=2803751 RepID=UPI0014924D57|nr:TIGR02588 family protein [Leptolyngbya sp. Cla-17]MBM0741435.1 TIGR02588 family protein [Leptolyngbya sp. Cla-17]